MKNIMWISDADTILKIIDLAILHGKKSGDNMQEEFEEIYKQDPEKFKFMGLTEKDIDLITGDLREEGKKVLNIHEISRKKENEKGENYA